MGFLANRRRLSDLKSKLDTLRLQVSIQWKGEVTESKAAEITKLLVLLRNAGKAAEAGAAVDEVRDKEWPVVGFGNDRVGAMESLALGGLRPAEGRDEKWAELMKHFDETLLG